MRAKIEVVIPDKIAKIICFLNFSSLQADKKKYKAKKKKKKADDSFSGIPAIVLCKKTGIIEKNREEINAIIFAFVKPNESINIFLTRKKKAITVIAKKKTG